MASHHQQRIIRRTRLGSKRMLLRQGTDTTIPKNDDDLGAGGEAFSAEDLVIKTDEEEFFESLGRTQSSLSNFSGKSSRNIQRQQPGGAAAAAAAAKVEHGCELTQMDDDVRMLEDDEDNYDSDDDKTMNPSSVVTRPSAEETCGGADPPELLRPVASWVKTMNHFEMRKTMAEELVREGMVYSELPETHVVPIQQQVDLDLYTYEEQQRRWEAGQSPVFQALCRDLWNLVRSEDDTLGREKYTELVFRFHYICCPPPLDAHQVLESTAQDWKTDSGGRETMDYAAFFRAIFQCVDIWTETSALKEYVALLKRLVAGAAIRLDDNTLQFKTKESVKFDEYFSMEPPPQKDNPSDQADTAAAAAAASARDSRPSIARDKSVQRIQAIVRGQSQSRRYQKDRTKVKTAQRAIRSYLGGSPDQKLETDDRYKSPYGQQPGHQRSLSSMRRRSSSSVASTSTNQGRSSMASTSSNQGRRRSKGGAVDDFDRLDAMQHPNSSTSASSAAEGLARGTFPDDDDGHQHGSSFKASHGEAVSKGAAKRYGQSDVRITADKVLHRRQGRKSAHEALLSPDQTSAMIAKCYQAKLQADNAALRAQVKGKKFEKSVRFDLFVVRFFKRSHGTIGIARRHLRVFVRSIEAMLDADTGERAPLALHPRVALFAEIVGISSRQHNARLCPSYLMPVLRALYPDVMAVSRSLIRRGELTAEPVPAAQMLDALQSALPLSVQGAEITGLLKAAIEPAKIDAKMVDPDQALWLALPTFKRLDMLVAFRRKRCANVATDYAKHYLKLRAARAAEARDLGPQAEAPAPTPELSSQAKKILEAREMDARYASNEAPEEAPAEPLVSC